MLYFSSEVKMECPKEEGPKNFPAPQFYRAPLLICFLLRLWPITAERSSSSWTIATQYTHLQVLCAFSVLDPDLALRLRINKQRIASGLGHYDTILYRQIIVGQALQVPLRHLLRNKRLFSVQFKREPSGTAYLHQWKTVEKCLFYNVAVNAV